ncbi:hypothetical protein PIB30_114331, partial [Stylosanthes scabra]|nr:hypothetical protein [Stylosanthes scabra]
YLRWYFLWAHVVLRGRGDHIPHMHAVFPLDLPLGQTPDAPELRQPTEAELQGLNPRAGRRARPRGRGGVRQGAAQGRGVPQAPMPEDPPANPPMASEPPPAPVFTGTMDYTALEPPPLTQYTQDAPHMHAGGYGCVTNSTQ